MTLSAAYSSTDILRLIDRIAPDLPASLLKVAEYLRDNKDHLVIVTIDDITKTCGVSKASVIRFCQALGFDGFRTFKRALLDDFVQERGSAAADTMSTSVGPSPENPVLFLQQLAAAAEASSQKLNIEAFASAVAKAAKARRLVWYGTGDSGFLAASGDHRSIINGINSQSVYMPEVLASITNLLGAEDVLICVSRSGRVASVLEPIRNLRQKSACTLIVITGDPGSPVAKLADYCLVSTPIDLYINGQRTTMQTAQMCMIDVFINALLRTKYPEVTTTGLSD